MAYIIAPEMRARLPMQGQGLDDWVIKAAIEEWVDLLEGISPGGGENGIARAAVAKGARADLLEIMFAGDAVVQSTAANPLRQQADNLVRQYDASVNTTEEDEAEVLKAYVEDLPW
jgi:hypothetical protein